MAQANAISSTNLSACAGLLTLAALMGCGGSGGGVRAVGGATGSGGITGGAGTSGLGGNPGTAGAGVGGMTAALDCSSAGSVDPAAPLLVDFSSATWMNTQGKWTTVAHDLTGSKYSAGSMLANPDGGSMMSLITNAIDTTAANPNFELKGNVILAAGEYGFGLLSFDKCVNTTHYTGVQFTLGGTAGGCDFLFLLQTFDQQGVTNRGGCTTGCYHFPQVKIPVSATPTVVSVHFADLAGTGMPDTADGMKAQIVGLQWQFQPAAPVGDAGQIACDGIDVTIDDVSFTTD